MSIPSQPITLTPEQVEALGAKLADLRHDINNHLSLLVAATELIRRRPELAERFIETVSGVTPKIAGDIKAFSNELESVLQITRD